MKATMPANNRYDVALVGLGSNGRLALEELKRHQLRVAAIGVEPGQKWASVTWRYPFDPAQFAQEFPNATLFLGQPRLLGPTTIEIHTDSEKRIVQARSTILTSRVGSPAHPVLRESARIHRYHEMYAWPVLGKRVAVVGGSADGLAVVWRTVTATHSPAWLLEESDHLAGEMDPEMGGVVERFLSMVGIEVRKQTRVVAYRETADEVTLEVEGTMCGTLTVDQVIITGPRRPLIEGLGLEQIGVDFDEEGFLIADSACRTRIPNVFAFGSITGWPFHAARSGLDAQKVVETVLSRSRYHPPRVFETGFYAGWDLCFIGVREVEVARCGLPLRRGWYLGPTFRGMHPDVLKVFVDEDEDLIVGAAAFGPYSSEYARRLAFCMEVGVPASYVAEGGCVGPGDAPEDSSDEWLEHWTPLNLALESALGRRSED